MMRIAAVLLLAAGCISDGHGHYGTRWMHEQWARAARDGSLECAAFMPWGSMCKFTTSPRQCVCHVPASASDCWLDCQMMRVVSFDPCRDRRWMTLQPTK